MSFARRKIDLTFRLGTGNFGESGSNTVKVSGLRVHASIEKAGGASMGTAHLRVFGLTMSMMNQLTGIVALIDGQIAYRANEVVVEAGDDVAGMSVIFQGQIAKSQIDMSGAPESALMIVGTAGLFDASKPVPAVSYPGSADAAVIMQNLATQSGYSFENNGVSVILSSPYFHGSARDQMVACANAAGIEWIIDDGVLAIWPKGGARGGAIPVVSPETGMVGYPIYDSPGITVRTVFNNQLLYGAKVKVESSLAFANGTFIMFHLAHELQSETPNGAWFTQFYGSVGNDVTQ
ncbi:hypothetical protein [Robbsia sp. KACC 23696]|uniref:baseplate hub protein n=1 Tax=Robbsia sp. KACC 23696 TaxID=3149231 RepID=UPI00325B4AAB